MSQAEILISMGLVAMFCLTALVIGWKTASYRHPSIRYVYIYGVFAFTTIVATTIMANLTKHTTSLRMFTLTIDLLLILAFYNAEMPKLRRSRSVLGFLVVFIICGVLHSLLISLPEAEAYKKTFLLRGYINLLVTILVMRHLYDLMKKVAFERIDLNPSFWVSVAFMFMYTANFIPEISVVYLFSLQDFSASAYPSMIILVIGNSLALIAYSLLAVAFLRCKRPQLA